MADPEHSGHYDDCDYGNCRNGIYRTVFHCLITRHISAPDNV
ncbi:hypothetical protein [Endozoicomonas euniceicola]|uniref:Uncharacterized protein n=1 Tax=Endozoicomonas euniceicola TaxID=1234143 RepID=A0ABY6GTX0_9GAMM|nr:hypothetical protein [Endozoicomonas euniceicola]UYM15834.1 hypothetical protein NX720_23915 [Endozoicomonas euniceicola]